MVCNDECINKQANRSIYAACSRSRARSRYSTVVDMYVLRSHTSLLSSPFPVLWGVCAIGVLMAVFAMTCVREPTRTWKIRSGPGSSTCLGVRHCGALTPGVCEVFAGAPCASHSSDWHIVGDWPVEERAASVFNGAGGDVISGAASSSGTRFVRSFMLRHAETGAAIIPEESGAV